MTREAFLTEAKERADTSDPARITIRDLIGLWGSKGRGYRVRAQVRGALKSRGLQTSPDFAFGHIDTWVRIVPIPQKPTSGGTEQASEVVEEEVEERFLRIDSLQCSQQGLEIVEPDADINKAITVMALRDFSQLAVGGTARHIQSAITWESIGRSRLVGSPSRVSDAVVPVATVALADDLLPLLSRVAASGFVFVRDASNLGVGIVTAADVTNEFGALAEPFFLLGEIERRLRSWLRRSSFTEDEYAAARFEGDEEREVSVPEDLTLGEVERLLQSPDSWGKVPWSLDRKIFLERLGEVRAVRNSLMHFSSDVPSDADTAAMRNLLAVLKAFA